VKKKIELNEEVSMGKRGGSGAWERAGGGPGDVVVEKAVGSGRRMASKGKNFCVSHALGKIARSVVDDHKL